jgi:hypothetical protein
MYWCNTVNRTKLILSLLICISVLAACRPDVQVNGAKRYFDLKGFVNADSALLIKNHAVVSKTVWHNESAPLTKQIKVNNWGQELSLFAASDINKPAWRDSYKILNQGDSVVYTAVDPHLITRRMVVQTVNGVVKKIRVDNFTQNLLYKTSEHLVYFPDSLYLIDKLQQVKLMGANHYMIRGVIKKF